MKKRKSEISHQKRYGQYFSGSKVADLLVALLPKNKEYFDIIDPMVGVGDLLMAITDHITSDSNIVGVEIDKTIINECSLRVPNAKIFQSDAFCSRQVIKSTGWDLVITNPPYVRYQLQNDDHDTMPSGESIRRNLCSQIQKTSHLSQDDKNLFISLAQKYSGLSDMAVPSWLLCAALVKMNGMLAIVVPDTWLNREYATPIQYMLLKCFDNITIARDVNSCWFDNALVRTSLVVAERKKTVSLSEGIKKDIFQLDLSRELIDTNSLVGGLNHGNLVGYDALAEIVENRAKTSGIGYASDTHKAARLFPNLTRATNQSKWGLPEDKENVEKANPSLPSELYQLVSDEKNINYISLQDIGVSCGQGLRTGANEFFYLTITDEDETQYFIKDKSWCNNSQKVQIPKKNIIKAVTNRNQIKGLIVEAHTLDKGLLFISNYIRPKDKNVCSPNVPADICFLSDPVCKYIDGAETYTNNKGLHFKELSAVAPNEKKDESGYMRFWYMLPPLTRRHLPNLCMTRINVGTIECLYVPQSPQCPVSVDANFSTLWADSEKTVNLAMALLNSSWSKYFFELISTVMGGGALKVEASHIKKVLFPKYSQEQLEALSER